VGDGARWHPNLPDLEARTHAARRLRLLSGVLFGGLASLIAVSVLAFGSVHPRARGPLFGVTALLALLAAFRDAIVTRLRSRLGSILLTLGPHAERPIPVTTEREPPPTWSFDLGQRPSSPLLLPGVLFLAWLTIQMVPVPAALADTLTSSGQPAAGERTTRWRPLTVSPAETAAGIAFVAWAIVMHLVAGSALDQPGAGHRFRRFLALLGVVLATFGLVQKVSGVTRIYGFFEPWESDGQSIFGPFVNRNHFGFYMLMVTAMSLGMFARAYWPYSVGSGPGQRFSDRSRALAGREGRAVLRASAVSLLCAYSLVATGSRGALIALGAGVMVGVATLPRGRAAMARRVTVVLLALAVPWCLSGRYEQLKDHFAADVGGAGRAAIWAHTLEHMDGRWLVGYGFNTFGNALGRSLPQPVAGETPFWFREAHNDYLQVLAETGVVGLAIALWAVIRVIASVRRDPFLLAGLTAALVHEFVDFGLQIPAAAGLFVTLAAMKPSETTDFGTSLAPKDSA
jgi:O-antigen ligase/polysaccharide polymerase Wzy-like membrane protein